MVHSLETIFYIVVEVSLTPVAFGVADSAGSTGENSHPLFDRFDRVDEERSLFYCFEYIVGEDEVTHVLIGDDYPLLPAEAESSAGVEEPFDLLVDSSHRLNLSHLVNGPGYGDILANLQFADR